MIVSLIEELDAWGLRTPTSVLLAQFPDAAARVMAPPRHSSSRNGRGRVHPYTDELSMPVRRVRGLASSFAGARASFVRRPRAPWFVLRCPFLPPCLASPRGRGKGRRRGRREAFSAGWPKVHRDSCFASRGIRFWGSACGRNRRQAAPKDSQSGPLPFAVLRLPSRFTRAAGEGPSGGGRCPSLS